MHRLLNVLGVVGVVSGVTPQPDIAAQSSTASIKACGLLPRAEVKKLINGNQVFDMMAPEEEPLGNYGSSCNYPGVMIQVMPFLQSTIDGARKRGRLEPVSGVGDEAWLYENPAGYAELYVRIDKRFLTLQRDIGMGQTLASVRPGVMALANALVARLR